MPDDPAPAAWLFTSACHTKLGVHSRVYGRPEINIACVSSLLRGKDYGVSRFPFRQVVAVIGDQEGLSDREPDRMDGLQNEQGAEAD